MKILVTGSSGHLGEAIARSLAASGRAFAALDVKPGPFTTHVGSITDPAVVASSMEGVEAVIHAATLHKPHVATHARQDFVAVNVSGTLALLEAAAARGVRAFVFTSTTSVFGDAMRPGPGAPAVWVDEALAPQVKNIYGATKLAAEHLCELAARRDGLPCLVLRTSRFFPEVDDDPELRARYPGENIKLNEFLNRRLDVEDAVSAHLLAAERAPEIGFARYVVSATTPFTPDDLAALRRDAPAVVRRHVDFEPVYRRLGWRMFPEIERVYVNAKARAELGWRPRHDFASMLAKVGEGEPPASALARSIGVKGYHDQVFEDGPYPTE